MAAKKMVKVKKKHSVKSSREEWKLRDEAFEREEFLRYQNIGLGWQPTRKLLASYILSQADTFDRLRMHCKFYGIICVVCCLVSVAVLLVTLA